MDGNGTSQALYGTRCGVACSCWLVGQLSVAGEFADLSLLERAPAQPTRVRARRRRRPPTMERRVVSLHSAAPAIDYGQARGRTRRPVLVPAEMALNNR